MVVQEIINLARYSELGNTALKQDNAANTATILSFINLGMLELYKRFALKTEEHIVALEEGTTIYNLPQNFMYPMSAYKEVSEHSEKTDEELPINDLDEPESIFFPNQREVQIPASVEGAYISIIYVAKPETVTADNLNEELDLPDVLIDCMLHFIGYRGHLGIRGDGQSENNAHFARFERSVMKAKEYGVTPSTDSYRMISRLHDRGFA
jgi:hypothetical protein